MIGFLPKSLQVDGKDYKIRSDFRVALNIFQAFNDPELADFEKYTVCLDCLFIERPENSEEAFRKAVWFLDGGDMPKAKPQKAKTLDWEQDESLIFPAVNKVAGFETREVSYLHWWSFLGLFNEIGEGLFSTVMNIRIKKAKGKKLEKYERDFYREHKELVDIKKKYSEEEQKEIDNIKAMLDG